MRRASAATTALAGQARLNSALVRVSAEASDTPSTSSVGRVSVLSRIRRGSSASGGRVSVAGRVSVPPLPPQPQVQRRSKFR